MSFRRIGDGEYVNVDNVERVVADAGEDEGAVRVRIWFTGRIEPVERQLANGILAKALLCDLMFVSDREL